MTEKPVRYDVDGPNEEGTDMVTVALRQLLNEFPGLYDDEQITFATLTDTGGIAMFPISGAAIETETQDITDHVTQVCLYPFYIVYRQGQLSQNRKANIKEWLDMLGKWLERQPVTVNGADYKLAKYPELTGGRKILSIARQTPSYLDSVGDDKVEDWAIYISARYQNEFDR
uniref:Uncharacterized protein n=1 Tax=Dulem virus 35 TaxID=3145753 RepID=A0AAU8AYN4_9CAUD